MGTNHLFGVWPATGYVLGGTHEFSRGMDNWDEKRARRGAGRGVCAYIWVASAVLSFPGYEEGGLLATMVKNLPSGFLYTSWWYSTIGGGVDVAGGAGCRSFVDNAAGYED